MNWVKNMYGEMSIFAEEDNVQPGYWVKYRSQGKWVKCRMFYKRDNAINFADTVLQRNLVAYCIVGY